MSKYDTFRFIGYRLDETMRTLTLAYGYDDELVFSEVFTFDYDWAPDINPDVLDRACQLLFFVAGVSYFKAYVPEKISVEEGTITPSLAGFLSKTYQKGLGEFFYINKLDPLTEIPFSSTTESELQPLEYSAKGMLIGLGGGKDSLVSTEILKDTQGAATWSVGHKSQLQPLVDTIGLPHYWTERQWDRQLLDLNTQGAYNGHVPISAILACAGIVSAVLAGKQDVVVSNEQSANEPNLTYNDVEINHQYSKSLEFEKDFQDVLRSLFGDSIRYYSLLRPLSELRIAELFAKTGFDKYRFVFSSCNKAFAHTSQDIFWCGECPKCAFVFLALTPFIDREKLEELFGGKNLLLEPSLVPLYRNLLGIEGDKPLECVGEIKESRAAMRLAQDVYPELDKYEFDLPEDYDYKKLGADSMPPEMRAKLDSVLS